MTRRPTGPVAGRARRLAAVLAACALALTACSDDGAAPETGPTPSGPSADQATTDHAAACADVTGSLLRATQSYVDGYGAPLNGRRSARDGSRPEPIGDEDLKQAMEAAQQDLQRLGCDIEAFRRQLREGLAGITAQGAVARAVLLQLEASMTGTAATQPRTETARPGDDLPRVLAALAPGSTLRLAAGSYPLDETVVLLQGVTLRGEGRGRTVIETSAADAGILVLTDGRVELRGLTVRHSGDEPATGLIGGPSSSVVLTKVRIAGAQARRGDGGTGVLMSARQGEAGGRGTTLEVTDSVLENNAAAGVLLTGGHRASIVGSEFRANRQCGVCFVGASAGAVRDGRFVGNGAGIAVVDTARPLLVRNRFTGGEVGVQAAGRAAPVVRRSTVRGSARAALIFSDRSRGRVDHVTCRDVEFGIVVAPKALPFLGDNDCTVARGR